MSGMPIEEAAHRAAEQPEEPGFGYPEQFSENLRQPERPESFMGYLINAQHKFIEAQYRFLQDSDGLAFMKAQDAFIKAQSECMQILRML